MEWIDSDYGFQKAKVARAYLSVGWDASAPKGTPGGYVATVSIGGGRTKVIKDREHAKDVIVSILRKTCEDILAGLPPEPEAKP